MTGPEAVGVVMLVTLVVAGAILMPDYWNGGSKARRIETSMRAASGERTARAVLRSFPASVIAMAGVAATFVAGTATGQSTITNALGAVTAILLVVDLAVMFLGRPRALIPPRLRR